jgi:hypothetical protein
VPKGIEAKPGKRKPTATEARWMAAIVDYGCVACRMDGLLVRGADGVYEAQRPAVHHILRGGRRIGHLFTLPLCDPGHHQNGARFEARYGAEFELLAKLKAELGVFSSAEYRP